MRNESLLVAVSCPYCGEPISLPVDCSIEQQSCIEDCPVCCNPINVEIRLPSEEDAPWVSVTRDDD